MKNKKNKLIILFIVFVMVCMFFDSTAIMAVIFEGAVLLVEYSTMIRTSPNSVEEDFYNKMFTRILIVFLLSFIIPFISMIDFFILLIKYGNKNSVSVNNTGLTYTTNGNIKCPHCGHELNSANKFCTNCGKVLEQIDANAPIVYSAASGETFIPSNFPIYTMGETGALDFMINNELKENEVDDKVTIKPLETKKFIATIIYAILLFITITLYFFHIPGLPIFLFVFSTIIYMLVIRSQKIVPYLRKQIKSRPDENIGYIVATIVSGKVNSKKNLIIRMVLIFIIALIPLIVFSQPRMMFEKQENGYALRFYTIGLFNNDKVIEVPSEYNGEPVIEIRGRVFAHVTSVEEIILPNTITEIRGNTFDGAKRLKKINIPDSVTRIGGYAFRDCVSLESIKIPSGVTEIGGYAFYGADNLKQINLPEGLTEIHGSTFEGCSSLKEITIPDSVTRIGGSAFRYNYSLEKVNISENSKLLELGSSAFRSCNKLEVIYLPKNTSIDTRTFKESPTAVRRYGVYVEPKEEEEIEEVVSFSKKEEILLNINVEKELVINNQTIYISLIEVIPNGDYYDYKFKYRDTFKEYEFIVSKDFYTNTVTNEFAISILRDYYFDLAYESIFINYYYN